MGINLDAFERYLEKQYGLDYVDAAPVVEAMRVALVRRQRILELHKKIFPGAKVIMFPGPRSARQAFRGVRRKAQ